MCHGLVDELGHENYGRDYAGHKADGTNDDVEVGQAHDSAVAEEAKEEENENANTNHKVYCDQAHIYDVMIVMVT